MTKWTFKTLLLFFLCTIHAAYGKEPLILVTYPTSEPLQSRLYNQVIAGIENAVGHPERLELPDGAVDVQQQLDRIRPDKVIVLGKKIAELIKNTSYRNKVLVGLANFNPTDYNGVSLALDSRSLVAHLSRSVPSIKRVFIVQQSGHQTIENVGTNLDSRPTLEIREGNDSLAITRIAGHLLMDEAKSSDAVLVPANLPNDMFYKIAELAWDKQVMLLSTNLYHLENGAMMVFYPDEAALGEQLGRLVNKKGQVYESTRAVKVALNRRIAQHLNVEFDPVTLGLFEIKIK